MTTSGRRLGVWTTLLGLCLTSNVGAEKIITSPDWPDPFVAGQLFVMFTEQGIETIVLSLEEGVEEGQLVTSPHSSGSISAHKFILSDPDRRPWVTGIASFDLLNRTYGLKSIEPAFYDDPYGRKDRVFVLVFPEDTDILRLMALYAQLKEVEYVYPNAVAAVTVIRLTSWGRIKALYLERRVD
jgi:hypothetical protein